MDAGSDARGAAVIVAAGRSSRFGAAPSGAGADAPRTRKPLLELEGRSLLELVCGAFAAAERVLEVVVVAHADDLERVRELTASGSAFRKVSRVVPGGAERADSVRIGSRAATGDADVLCVHDAARPLVQPATIDASVLAAAQEGAALVALPVHDTIKEADDARGERVTRTLDRSRLWSAQTPQAFRRERFLAVLERAEAEAFRPTDDSALWERYVGAVTIVRGDVENLKVTTPADLELARAILARRRGG